MACTINPEWHREPSFDGPINTELSRKMWNETWERHNAMCDQVEKDFGYVRGTDDGKLKAAMRNEIRRRLKEERTKD